MGEAAYRKRIMADNGEHYNAIVIGLGRTGLSCARFLAAQGIAFAVMDSRPEPPELGNLKRLLPEVPVYLGGFDAQMLCNTDRIILSPGVAMEEPAIRTAVNEGIEVVGDIELFARQAAAPVVAVTGSNGKSTVATLITDMIRSAGMTVQLGGNIGTPALDLLSEPVPDFYVLELSSFQLETVQSLHPAAAVVLNVTADHMDRYPDLAAYAVAKQRIYLGAEVMVINDDDACSRAMKKFDRSIIPYTIGEPEPDGFGILHRNGEDWLARNGNTLIPVKELSLSGRHNISNVLAALALGAAINLPEDSMLAVLRTFTGLKHRCQRVAVIKDVEWINDSKGTNVGAACAAVTGLAGDNNLIWIAGGDGKAADFSPLTEAVAGRVHTAVLIGRDASRIDEAIKGATNVLFATTLESAVAVAAEVARPGDRVLLSPACASFDMFRDYQERGEVFMAAVQALASGSGPA